MKVTRRKKTHVIKEEESSQKETEKNQGKTWNSKNNYVHPYHHLEPERAKAAREALLHWFSIYRRRLPWRGDLPPYSSGTDTRKRTLSDKQESIKHWFQSVTYEKEEQPLTVTLKDASLCKQTNPPVYRATAYGTWISEVMLQQTQVAVVIPYWLKWMSKWPTLTALAQASESDVCLMWSGLGYYQRALRLLKAARDITLNWLYKNVACLGTETTKIQQTPKLKKTRINPEDYEMGDGNTNTSRNTNSDAEFIEKALKLTQQKQFPESARWDIPFPRESLKDLMKFNGIGEYTAGAILSISFGQAVPAIDGNVIRIVARLLAFANTPQSVALKTAVHQFLTRWISEDDPGSFNQALMDLGASVCTPRTPVCTVCPLRSFCITYKEVNSNDRRNERRHLHSERKDHPTCTVCDVNYENSATDAATYPLKKQLIHRSTGNGKSDAKAWDVQPNSRIPEHHMALVIYVQCAEHTSFLLVQRPRGLLGEQWGPIVVPMRVTDDPHEECSKISKETVTLLLKESLYSSVLFRIGLMRLEENMHYKQEIHDGITTWASNEKPWLQDTGGVTQLGHVKHIFSHVTHCITVIGMPMAEYCIHSDSDGNKEGYRWVAVPHHCTDKLSKLQLVSVYMKKIMKIFFETVTLENIKTG